MGSHRGCKTDDIFNHCQLICALGSVCEGDCYSYPMPLYVATPASQNVTLQVWILFLTLARSYFFRFIFLIDCRVLYTRAMLLRPVVLAAAKNRKNPAWMAQGLTNAKLEDYIALRVCLMCVDIVHASQVLKILQQRAAFPSKDGEKSPSIRSRDFQFLTNSLILYTRRH